MTNQEQTTVERKLFALDTLFEVGRVITSSLNLESVLENILLTSLGSVSCTRGMLLLRVDQNHFVVKIARGKGREYLKDQIIEIPQEIKTHLFVNETADDHHWLKKFREWGIELILPIRSRNMDRGLLCLGAKATGNPFEDDEISFLQFLADLSVNSINNGLMYDKLKTTNRNLDLKIHELQTLFDVTKELTSSLNTDEILNTLILSLMGQLMVSRCAIILDENNIPTVKTHKGFRIDAEITEFLDSVTFEKLVENFTQPRRSHEINHPEAKKLCERLGLEVLVPMKLKDKASGIMALGKKRLQTEFSEYDLDYLSALATQAMIALENARLFKDTLEKERMEEELRVARTIQQGLLPKNPPSIDGFDIFGMNIPSLQVGGDYFDFIPITSMDWGIAIGDVSGKGTPAALLMASLQATLWAQVENHLHISEIVSKVNDAICRTTESGQFITFFYGVLNSPQNILTYCNAGHNYPIVHHNDGRVERLYQGDLILGIGRNMPYNEYVYYFQPGDTLVFYTDGVDEAINQDNEEFGEDALIEVVQKYHYLTARELTEKIRSEVQRYVGENPQYDDITLIVCKRL